MSEPINYVITGDEINEMIFRHKKRTDSDQCRVDGDGRWPCRELRAAIALAVYRKTEPRHDQQQ